MTRYYWSCFIKVLPQAYFSNSLYIPKYFYFKIEQIITSSGGSGALCLRAQKVE